MACTATLDLLGCGKQRPCRQPELWLQRCPRHSVAGSCVVKQRNFGQLQQASGSCVQATAAQAQKQLGRGLEQGLPDTSELRPDLQQEWHPDNNAVLGSIKVKPYSHGRVMWSCPNCPAGCPHVWEATVTNRTRGSKCPYCDRRAVCQHNSLASKAPRQVKYWNQTKNVKTPEQTLAGSTLWAEWKCRICSHEWQARIGARVDKDSGCSHCSRANAVNTKQPTLDAVHRALLLQWDYERNAGVGIHPQSTTLGSHKRVHWMCQKSPAGRLHRYQMHPNSRTSKLATGCPYCDGKQVCKCNSLDIRYPMISQEWDFAKNDLTPAQVTSKSHQVVWWLNAVRGSWAQAIKDRTRHNPK